MRKDPCLFMAKLIVLTGILLTGSVFAVLSVSVLITNTGNVKTLGDLESDTSFIEWIDLETNSTRTHNISVRVTGNSPAVLSLSTGNWTPSNASDYLALSWNYTGATLQPYVWTPIELTMTVASNATGGNFAFDIIIIGQEV